MTSRFASRFEVEPLPAAHDGLRPSGARKPLDERKSPKTQGFSLVEPNNPRFYEAWEAFRREQEEKGVRFNFSAYVRGLILEDLKRRGAY